MANLYTSLTDPIFWLHHSNLDRLWHSWQAINPKDRMHDIVSPEVDISGGNITTDYLLRVGFTGTTIPIQDVMDVTAWPWCRDFETLYTL
jgi:tyrosinase